MLKRDELATAVSCLNKAADDEPLFVLRAHDESAPGAVAAWARNYILDKGGWGKMSQLQQDKYSEAMEVASNMRIWKMHQLKRGHS